MSLEKAGLVVMCLFMAIGFVAALYDGPNSKPPTQQNVRLPRKTLWERAREYFGEPK